MWNDLKKQSKRGPKKVATSCNFCMIMMDDARKVTSKDESMEVVDIAELIAERI